VFIEKCLVILNGRIKLTKNNGVSSRNGNKRSGAENVQATSASKRARVDMTDDDLPPIETLRIADVSFWHYVIPV